MNSLNSLRSLISGASVIFLTASAWTQDSTSMETSAISIRGYVRLNGMFEKSSVQLNANTATWLHARINVDHSFSESIRFRVDLRTQIFYANDLESWPGYTVGFRLADESLNLHALWWKQPHSLAHTNVERALLSYRKHSTSIQVGRQRINWGMALTWNPNDLFQSGNPFDPDYVERPGVDAIRIERTTGSLSGFEVAMACTGNGSSRGAWRYFSNYSGYDWQAIVGWIDQQPTIGFGFSGKLGSWSFRGEAQQYFRSIDELADNLHDLPVSFIVTEINEF